MIISFILFVNLSKFIHLSYLLKFSYVYKKSFYMKRSFILISILLSVFVQDVSSQPGNDTLVFLLTCGPGTETYSIYGHSALRIIHNAKKSDYVYNWGVFDFDTPNFAWKFAKGRLDYMLGVESIQGFLQIYYFEKRFVLSQKMNLSPSETARLIGLINENLEPENIKYRYDFFYDDCSTRIRDLIEKAVGEKLLYPPDEKEKSPTFRDMTGKYQNPFPWLKFGIDLIMGSPGDKNAPYRDRMFLPIDLQKALTESVVNRDGKMIPLLQNPDKILDFDPPEIKQRFLLMPAFIFTIAFIFILILSALVKRKKFIYWFDIVLYFVFSILAVLMIFFNFFTDHQQMRWNLNIIWLNPIILICFVLIIIKREGTFWFRLLFYISVVFLTLHFLLPQSFNIAILPLTLILLIRSSLRAGFEWNPLSVK
jgi:hypothetical protein